MRWLTIILITAWFIPLSYTPIASADDKLPPQTENQNTTSRHKSYAQRYKDFFQSDNYAERYREAYDPENYRDWYIGMHNRRHYIDLNDVYKSPSSNDTPTNYGLIQPFSHSPKPLSVPPASPKTQPVIPMGPAVDPSLPILSSLGPSPMVPYYPQKEFVLWQDSFFLYDRYNRMYNQNRSTEDTISSVTAENQQENQKPSSGAILHSPQELLYIEGVKAFSQRKYQAANKCFRTLDVIKKQTPAHKAALGLSFFALGNYKQAATYLLDEKVTPKTLNLKQFYGNNQDYNLHHSRLERFVKTYPSVGHAKQLLDFLDSLEKQ